MGKKKDKTKIPKTIAGVKVPKELRKKAKVAVALAENPAVRDLAAAALAAAAGALANSRKAQQAMETAADEGAAATDHVAAETARIGETIKKVAGEIALGMLSAVEDSLKGSKPAAKGGRKTG